MFPFKKTKINETIVMAAEPFVIHKAQNVSLLIITSGFH